MDSRDLKLPTVPASASSRTLSAACDQIRLAGYDVSFTQFAEQTPQRRAFELLDLNPSWR